jgi:hypothetical protein
MISNNSDSDLKVIQIIAWILLTIFERDSLTRFAHMFFVSIDRSHIATPYGMCLFAF